MQDLNKSDISRLKGRHEALLASREAMEKGAPGSGDGEDFIPLDAKVQQTIILFLFCLHVATGLKFLAESVHPLKFLGAP